MKIEVTPSQTARVGAPVNEAGWKQRSGNYTMAKYEPKPVAPTPDTPSVPLEGSRLCIAAGMAPSTLMDVMTTSGVDEADAVRQVDSALTGTHSLGSLCRRLCSLWGVHEETAQHPIRAFDALQRIEHIDPRKRLNIDTRQTKIAAASIPRISEVLDNFANKILLSSFEAQPAAARPLMATREVSDFKAHETYTSISAGLLESHGQIAELPNIEIAVEQLDDVQLKSIGGQFNLTERDVLNDDIGVLRNFIASYARSVEMTVDQAAAAAIAGASSGNDAADDTLFFNQAAAGSRTANLLSGAGSALDLAGYQAAATALADQTDQRLLPCDFPLRYIYCPNALKGAAQETLQQVQTMNDPGFDVRSTGFLVRESADASQTRWYGIYANNDTAPLLMTTLAGETSPTIRQGVPDINIRGTKFVAYWALAVSLSQPRCIIRNEGV